MSPLKFIRQEVFGVSQVEMARLAGVRQPQVSRWENGIRRPSLRELRNIRKAALARGIAWDDQWFFEVPERAA